MGHALARHWKAKDVSETCLMHCSNALARFKRCSQTRSSLIESRKCILYLYRTLHCVVHYAVFNVRTVSSAPLRKYRRPCWLKVLFHEFLFKKPHYIRVLQRNLVIQRPEQRSWFMELQGNKIILDCSWLAWKWPFSTNRFCRVGLWICPPSSKD